MKLDLQLYMHCFLFQVLRVRKIALKCFNVSEEVVVMLVTPGFSAFFTSIGVKNYLGNFTFIELLSVDDPVAYLIRNIY